MQTSNSSQNSDTPKKGGALSKMFSKKMKNQPLKQIRYYDGKPNENKLFDALKVKIKSSKESDYIHTYITQFPKVKEFLDNCGEDEEQNNIVSQRLCKNMTLEQFNKGQVIIQENDESNDKFYIIIQGQVGIYVNKQINVYKDQNVEKVEINEPQNEQPQQKRQSHYLTQGNNLQVLDNNPISLSNNKSRTSQFQPSINSIQENDLDQENSDEIDSDLEKKFKEINQIAEKNRNKQLCEVLGNTLKIGNIIQSNSYNLEGSQQPQNSIIDEKNSIQQDSNLNSSRHSVQKEFGLKKKQSFVSNSNNLGLSKYRNSQLSSGEFDIFLKSAEQQYGNQVNILGPGDHVGAKALEAVNPKDAVRNATCFCLEDTDVIVMMKKDFKYVQQSFDKQNILKQKIICQQLPPLNLIINQRLKQDRMDDFKSGFARSSQVLYSEGEIGNSIFIFLRGKLKVEKKVKNPKNIYYEEYIQVQVCTIDNPCFFGEEICLNSKSYEVPYNYTVTVVSNSEFYILDKHDLIHKFPPDVLQYIKEQYKLKEQGRQDIYENQIRIMKLNKENEKANDLAHKFNKLQNQEVFNQMRYNSIDNHNKKHFLKNQQEQQQTELKKEQQEQYEFFNDYRLKIAKEQEEISMKKQLLQYTLNKFSNLLPNSGSRAQMKKQKQRIKNVLDSLDNKMLTIEILQRSEQIKSLCYNLKYNKIKIEDIHVEELEISNQMQEALNYIDSMIEQKNDLDFDRQETQNFQDKQQNNIYSEGQDHKNLNTPKKNNKHQEFIQQQNIKSSKYQFNLPSDLMYKSKVFNPKQEKESLVNTQGEFQNEIGLGLGQSEETKRNNFFKLITWGLVKPKNIFEKGMDHVDMKEKIKKIKEYQKNQDQKAGTLMKDFYENIQQNSNDQLITSQYLNKTNNQLNGNIFIQNSPVYKQQQAYQQPQNQRAQSAVQPKNFQRYQFNPVESQINKHQKQLESLHTIKKQQQVIPNFDILNKQQSQNRKSLKLNSKQIKQIQKDQVNNQKYPLYIKLDKNYINQNQSTQNINNQNRYSANINQRQSLQEFDNNFEYKAQNINFYNSGITEKGYFSYGNKKQQNKNQQQDTIMMEYDYHGQQCSLDNFDSVFLQNQQQLQEQQIQQNKKSVVQNIQVQQNTQANFDQNINTENQLDESIYRLNPVQQKQQQMLFKKQNIKTEPTVVQNNYRINNGQEQNNLKQKQNLNNLQQFFQNNNSIKGDNFQQRQQLLKFKQVRSALNQKEKILKQQQNSQNLQLNIEDEQKLQRKQFSSGKVLKKPKQKQFIKRIHTAQGNYRNQNFNQIPNQFSKSGFLSSRNFKNNNNVQNQAGNFNRNQSQQQLQFY